MLWIICVIQYNIHWGYFYFVWLCFKYLEKCCSDLRKNKIKMKEQPQLWGLFVHSFKKKGTGSILWNFLINLLYLWPSFWKTLKFANPSFTQFSLQTSTDKEGVLNCSLGFIWTIFQLQIKITVYVLPPRLIFVWSLMTAQSTTFSN